MRALVDWCVAARALLLLLTWAGLGWAGARARYCTLQLQRERMGGGPTYDELDALLLGELAGARIGSN